MLVAMTYGETAPVPTPDDGLADHPNKGGFVVRDNNANAEGVKHEEDGKSPIHSSSPSSSIIEDACIHRQQWIHTQAQPL